MGQIYETYGILALNFKRSLVFVSPVRTEVAAGGEVRHHHRTIMECSECLRFLINVCQRKG